MAWHRALVRRHPNLLSGCLHLPACSGFPTQLACPPALGHAPVAGCQDPRMHPEGHTATRHTAQPHFKIHLFGRRRCGAGAAACGGPRTTTRC